MWTTLSYKTGVQASNDDWASYEMPSERADFDLMQDSIIHLQNQVNYIKRKKEIQQANLLSSGGQGVESFGIYEYQDSTQAAKTTYLTTKDWGFIIGSDHFDATIYHSKGGKSFIRYPIITKISKHHFKYRYEDREVGFKYDLREKQILLPLQKPYQKLIANTFLWIIVIISFFVMLFGIVLFIRFLIAVSLNRIFEEYNILRLLLISLSCFLTVLFPYLVALVLYVVYNKELSVGLVFLKKFSSTDFSLIVAGIFFAVLYRAFKKGKALKEENELTV
ncbi:hypothetical protein AB669_10845 [Pedobacter sp. BMA]|nr:hypothetical protein AB669_10845 [Pedobacter sp. BMA]